jgi:two-component system, cell cycle sensor histidine kinase and response regulator CckA
MTGTIVMPGKKILVVDNHPVVLKFMRNLLEKEGHEVVTADSGLTALDILKTFTPNLGFIDLVMPNIDGEKLCRIIRKTPELKGMALIIVSGIAADEEIDFTSFGADACIAKGPFHQMGRHVLEVVERLECGNWGSPQAGTIGVEALFPREITKELLSVKRDFEMILETMTQGILEITTAGRIIYVNPSAASLVNTPEEKLLSTRLTDLFQESERQRVETLLRELRSSGTCVYDNAPLVLNGRLVLVKILPVTRGHARAIVMFDDVTERIQMQHELQKVQKIEALGTLAGGIAHAFNNLLMVIIGNISLAKMHAGVDRKLCEKLELAEQAIVKARELTNELLPFSTGGAPIRTVAGITELIEEVCTSTLEESGTRCQITISKELRPVSADLTQIRQVIAGLIANADEAMPNGGLVEVRAENVSSNDNPMLSLKQGEYVKISVRDRGCGIAEEHLARVFDPYFTTKQMGRGLGLAAAYSIIDKHSGGIAVHSDVDRGTTFCVYLPAVVDQSPAQIASELHAKMAKSKVLVMDDEEAIRDVTGQMLRNMGYSVSFASDGAEAIRLYQEAHEAGDSYGIVLMDLTIPGGMGGKEAVRDLLRIDREANVIVCSGYGSDPVMSQYNEYGFRGVLHKPYNMRELQNALLKFNLESMH